MDHLPKNAFLLFLLLSPLLHAQEPPVIREPADLPAEPIAAETGHAGGLGSFIDGLMAAQFEAHHLAGAVIAIVQDGEIELSRGFGYADIERRKMVDPATTLFRLASVSKLFTWTAVMQLAETGRLRLDEDVNAYLEDLEIPEAFEQPVTLRDLMTHTAGFEDRVLRLFARSEEAMIPLKEILLNDFPKRVRAPGMISSYSNHGTALAGLIVSQVTGVPWERYVTERILNPLGMRNTTVRQPVPEELREDLATGYEWQAGRLEAKEFEWVPAAPAGGMSASAEDMARFLLLHMQNGQFEGERLLSPQTARQMREEVFSHDPRVQGMGYGFIRQKVNGMQLVGHAGDTFYSHTLFALVPERDLGIFLAYNSAEGSLARDQFVEAFFDYLYPEDERESPSPLPGFSDRVDQIAGAYRSTRRPFTTIGKLIELFSAVSVDSRENGVISTSGGMSNRIRLWTETEPFVFQQQDGDERMVFRWNEEEERTFAYLSNLPILAFEKLVWYERPLFHLSLLGICLLFLLSTIFIPIVAPFINTGETRMLARRSPSHSSARWLAASVSVIHLVFLGGLAVVLSDPTVVVFGVPYELKLLLLLPLIAAAMTLMLIIVALLAWKGAYWSFIGRLHYSLVALCALVLIWQYGYWKLLGWNFY